MAGDPLTTPVQFVKGVGPYLASVLEKKGIKTVYDLFYYFPIRYLDRRKIDSIRNLTPGKEKCVAATVVGCGIRPLRNSRRRIFEMVVTDQTGIALIVWFHFNEKYLKGLYPAGKKVLIAGECQLYGQQKQFVHPEIEDWDEDWEARGSGLARPSAQGGLGEASGQSPMSIVPVYSLTEGLYQKTVRKILKSALDKFLPSLEESPLSVRQSGEVKWSLSHAIAHIHSPPESADLTELNAHKTAWHKRVIYDEIFYLQLGMALKKVGRAKETSVSLPTLPGLKEKITASLPFSLTAAQNRVIGEILRDIADCKPMNRLLQGDVGSGKTLVAFICSLQAAKRGYQAVMMAPTEILAQQHFKNLEPIATKMDVRTALMTRSTPAGEREEILKDLQAGRILLVFGTHALIQEDVKFKNLVFIVIDEQHRFGVMQRATLRGKGETKDHRPKTIDQRIMPHILVMTATPIPRTLAMGVYGDLDISVIDELPSGRRPITTHVYSEKMRSKAYDLIRGELKKERQAYFVYPLIEESEKSDLKDATAMANLLADIFSEYRVALLHGRMKALDKETIMSSFRKNEIRILVSTTVIEVGVDVPNATVMVVEHAERFGLSQLHQLRGRVGRGGEQSFCLLMAGYAQSEEARFRLRVMEETNDGFKIAEEDLKIRGPGDFLGTRQSGLPEFYLTHILSDPRLAEQAKERALEVLKGDPTLEKEQHRLLRKILAQRWEGRLELGNIC